MIAFIDDHREAHGVEPICKVLPIAPSTYRAQAARRRDPAKLPARAKRDAALMPEIERVFEENFRVYGVRKVWRQLKREGHDLARCTVARLMRSMGLQGVIRGKPVRTTISDKAAPCPLDHVNRQFKAPRPNALWVSDFTHVATWSGFVYVASSSTPMRGGSSAGACRGRRRQASCWMRWNRPCTSGARCIAAASFITATGAASTFPSTTPSVSRRPASSRRSAAWATAMTTPWPAGRIASSHQRSLQGRGHSPARPLALARGRRIRHPRMGGLVQPPAAPGAHRKHPAGRGGSTLPRGPGQSAPGSVTHTKQPPANPGRFKECRVAVSAGDTRHCHATPVAAASIAHRTEGLAGMPNGICQGTTILQPDRGGSGNSDSPMSGFAA